MIGNKAALHALWLLACASGAEATAVAVCTDSGRFVIELADAEAPKHVENFLSYVDMAYYSGTVFHRVVADFVVQGGGVDRQLRGRPTLPPVENESRNGLKNARGTVAAARSTDPHSATAQFYVNLKDNDALDARDDFGYTVFGRVTEGMEVLEAINRLPTGPSPPFQSDVPTPLVAMHSVARFDPAAVAALPTENRDAAIKERILTAAAAEDYVQALEWIGHYRAACGAADAEIAVIEADASLKTDREQRAKAVLEELFAVTDDGDPSYERALALYRTAVPEDRSSAGAELVSECESPVAPEIADGATATREAMVGSQAAVRAFVAASEGYLECLAKVIDDQARPPEQRNAAVAEHNRMVAVMEQVAGDFNEQLRIFKARG